MLKFVVPDLATVPAAMREHYTKAEDGTFTLALDGHPDAAKLSEFRAKNVELLKAAAKFEGVDPEAVVADRARITDLEAQLATAPQRVTELEAHLASEKAARVTAQQKADRSTVRHALQAKAIAAGVLPAALDIFLDKAEAKFTVVNDTVQAKPDTFSPSRPGELLTPEEFVLGAITGMPFLFAPSVGSGATGSRPGAVASDGKTVLRNPTPQELGEHAKAITQGTVRVEYTT